MIDKVKHEAMEKVAKLLKELAEEKALVGNLRHHEKLEHQADEKRFHSQEDALKSQDTIKLEKAEAKAAGKLSKEAKALKHAESVLKGTKVQEKKDLTTAQHKYKKEVAKISETLEKVVEKALADKKKYHKIIGNIKDEQRQEHAVDQRVEQRDEKRLALLKKETMSAVGKAAQEKALVN